MTLYVSFVNYKYVIPFLLFSVSLSTLQRSRGLVDALFKQMGLFSFAEIRLTTLQVQNISGIANSQVYENRSTMTITLCCSLYIA